MTGRIGSLRKAVQMLVKRRTLALTMLILAVTAGTALAVTLTGDGTLIGTNGPDTLNLGGGNDTAWGLAGSDTINATNPSGSGTLHGDGICPQNDQGTIQPPGSTVACEEDQNQDQQGQQDVFNVGSGNYTMVGGGATNTYNVSPIAASTTDVFWGGRAVNTFNMGMDHKAYGGNFTVHLCGTGGTEPACLPGTTNTVNLDPGATGVVYAVNGQRDTINCKTPNTVTVYADQKDQVNGCAYVHRGSQRSRDAGTAKHLAKRSTHKAKKSTHKAKKHAHKQTKPAHNTRR